MFGKTRSKIRGKPFKLFSDELPNFEYGETNDTDPFKEAQESRRSRGKKKRLQSFNDRLSLPSLGTPERDDLSFTMSDSRISSSQSSNQNTMSPDLQQLQGRIRNRHGIKENQQKEQRIGLPRRSTTIKLEPADRPIVFKRIISNDREKFSDKRKGGTIETHVDRYENAFTEDFGKVGGKERVNVSRSQPKSILQQLLDASARDFHKRKQINDGLIPSPIDTLYKSPSVRLSSGDVRRNHPSDPTEASVETQRERKPGILKRDSQNRHSVKVPKVPAQSGPSPKPRLIHHEDLEDFEEYASRYVPSPGAIISVHCDVPRNKMNDMLLMPQKKPKAKRVYFKDNNELHELPSDENDENFNNETRFRGPNRRPSRHCKSSPYPNEEIDIKFELNPDEDKNGEEETGTLIANNNRLLRSRSLKPRNFKGKSRRSGPFSAEDFQSFVEHEPRTEIMPNKDKKQEYGIPEDEQNNNYPSEIFSEDKSSIYSSPSSRKELQFLSADTEARISNRGKPPIPPINPSINSRIISEPMNSNRPETPRSTKLRRAESDKISRPLNIPPLLISNENGAHFNENFTGSRNPEAIGLDELPGDFDLSELPEDIDRSLDGVELIKAYRLWDRERKAFPAGLRKIDIPFDPRDFILSKLRNVNAKSQRSQKQEVKVTLI